jgi:hypothetical protein
MDRRPSVPKSSPSRPSARGNAALATTAGNNEEQKALQVPVMEGDPVEVWSNTAQVWCAGYVEQIRGNMLCLAYQVPGANACEWSRKSMPSEHQLWRKLSQMLDYESKASPGGDVISAFSIGDEVEIFSNSNQVWCPGRITKQRQDMVTVCFQLPSAGAEDWLEKDVKVGDRNLRHANLTAGRKTVNVIHGVNFSDAEKECYEREFVECYFASSPDDEPGSVTASGLQVANHLACSGLPKRTLKEIWKIANPESSAQMGRSQFFLGCRLVAHCQFFESDEAKQLMAEGGPHLAGKLRQHCVNSVPSRLPDFTVTPPL